MAEDGEACDEELANARPFHADIESDYLAFIPKIAETVGTILEGTLKPHADSRAFIHTVTSEGLLFFAYTDDSKKWLKTVFTYNRMNRQSSTIDLPDALAFN